MSNYTRTRSLIGALFAMLILPPSLTWGDVDPAMTSGTSDSYEVGITNGTQDKPEGYVGPIGPDPELNSTTAQVIWQDKKGRLLLAPIESSGDIPLAKQKIIDTGLLLSKGNKTANGPEWISNQKYGSSILYTKSGSGSNLSIWLANLNGTKWKVKSTGVKGLAPIGSEKENDPDPKYIYGVQDKSGKIALYWSELYGKHGGLISSNPDYIGRWVNSESDAVVYTEEVEGVSQVILYDINSKSKTQLTDSAYDLFDPQLWDFPAAEGGAILAAIEMKPDLSQQIVIYSPVDGGWERTQELKPPTADICIWSLEYFIFNGKTGLTFMTGNGTDRATTTSSNVWITYTDGDTFSFQELNDPNEKAYRNDPETFVTADQLFVYYEIKGMNEAVLVKTAPTL